MPWRVRVTGSGVVAAEGGQYPEIKVPHGEYAMTRRIDDGRYELTGGARPYLIVAPENIGADAYLEQKIQDGTLRIIEGEWP